MTNHTSLAKTLSRKGIRMGAAVVASTTLFLAACETPTPNTTAVDPQPQTGQENVTVGEINDETTQLLGQTVTVRSEIEETADPNSFRLEDNELFGGEDILVFNATGTPFVLPADDDVAVQVTGPVRQFVFTDVEQQYGLTLDAANYQDYEDRPVIFAESLALAPEPEDISENPEQFYNQPIAVEGNIGNVTNPEIFELNEPGLFGGENVLVLNASAGTAIANAPVATIEDGETVVIVGELRPFVRADIERDYELGWDLDTQEQLEVDYQNEPVLVAREIYPSAQ